MQSIRIERYGGPEVIMHCDVAVPTPKPDEVLVRLAYSGINFMDVHTHESKYAGSRTYPVRQPTTLGIEGAGTIVETGNAVEGLQASDRVA
ncbi:MAG TPA: alcohol dehydrogenase catalytic domain-containing protein [Burkholderiales bacterium]|nr:alcohol dehydrogenase catalytic domain-containing protein [Burkholderiales bacterium]